MRKETTATLAILASVSGTAFMSGRELALFFAQLGGMSWLSALGSAALFGALCGCVCHFARQTGASTVSGMLVRLLGSGAGRATCLAHGLLALATAGWMLVCIGHLTALTVAVRHAFWMGMAGGLAVALALNLGRRRGIVALGGAVLLIGGGFFLAMLLDGRAIAYYRNYEVMPRLKGSVAAALAFSAMHASLNACLAAGTAARFAYEVRPLPMAWRAGAAMGGMLLLANGALLRGGERLLVQAMPLVLLAARWGKYGFCLAVLFKMTCAVATLTAAVGTLRGEQATRVKI